MSGCTRYVQAVEMSPPAADTGVQSCVECLESGEAMHVRNAIIVLTEVLPVFPLKEVSHNSGPAILNAVRQLLEKEARPDLFNMAQS